MPAFCCTFDVFGDDIHCFFRTFVIIVFLSLKCTMVLFSKKLEIGYNNMITNSLFIVSQCNSSKPTLEKVRQRKTYKNPKFAVKVLHNLQLQSRDVTLIFLLMISNAWDSDFFRQSLP